MLAFLGLVIFHQAAVAGDGQHHFLQRRHRRQRAQAFNQAHKCSHFGGFGAHAASGLPQRDALLGGGRLNGFNRARADAARGHVDYAQQGIVVVGVHR